MYKGVDITCPNVEKLSSTEVSNILANHKEDYIIKSTQLIRLVNTPIDRLYFLLEERTFSNKKTNAVIKQRIIHILDEYQNEK